MLTVYSKNAKRQKRGILFCGMLFSFGCGEVHHDLREGGGFSVSQIEAVKDITLSFVETYYPAIKADVEAYGYTVLWYTTDEQSPCGAKHIMGCTECGGWMALRVINSSCIADTAMGHEWLHYVGCVEGNRAMFKDDPHQAPYFQVTVGENSWDYEINKQIRKELCDGR